MGTTLRDKFITELVYGIDPSTKPIKDDSVFDEFVDDPVRLVETQFHDRLTKSVKRMYKSVQDFPVTLVKSANGVGKTHGIARLGLWWFLTRKESQVYTLAAPPLENLTRQLWSEIGTVVTKNKSLFAPFHTGNLLIRRDSASFIAGIAIPKTGTREERVSSISGKHAPHLLFLVDEGDGVPDEIYEGIDTCRSGGDARMAIAFNPKTQRGPVYELETRGGANVVKMTAFNHPNVITGKNIIPGAVTRDKTIKRINEWTLPIRDSESYQTYFEVPDYLIGMTAIADDGHEFAPLPAGRRRIVNPKFSYMVLAEYPDSDTDRLIDESWIETARKRYDDWIDENGNVEPENGIRPIIGFDPAEMGNDESVACIRTDGFIRFTSWRGQDTYESSDRMIRLYKRYNPESAFIDAIGIGAGIAPRMRRKNLRAHPIKTSGSATVKMEDGEFDRLRDQLLWAVREWLRSDPNAMLPDDPLLLEELRFFTYGYKANRLKVLSKEKFRAAYRRSCDRLDALALTFAPRSLQTGGRFISW